MWKRVNALVALALLCGCLTQQAVIEKYVCADGWVAEEAGGCAGRSPQCPKCVCAQANAAIEGDGEATTAGKSLNGQGGAAAEPAEGAAGGTVKPGLGAEGQKQGAEGPILQTEDPCTALGCPAGTQYVSSRSSGKFHRCDCRFGKTLSAKNRICFGGAAEAEVAGKKPCGICAAGPKQ
jgi:hypothetical protein